MGLPKDKPDAVAVPRPFMPDGRDPHQYFKAKFGPLFGTQRVEAYSQGSQYFVQPKDAPHSLQYPTGHLLAPRERFAWYVVQETRTCPPLAEPRAVGSWRDDPAAIKFGYLKDDDEVVAPSADEKWAFDRATANFEIEFRSKVKRRAELVLKGDSMDAADREEQAAIERYFSELARTGPPTLRSVTGA